jgi:ABC-type multidrug transport system fused ATPase/permease subunit
MAKQELVSKILSIFPIKKENFILTEFKWFSTEMIITAIAFGIIFCYGYLTLKNTGVILAGNLVILYQYLEKFSGSFYNFAWSYEGIVKMNSELQTVDSILDEHRKLSRNPDILETDSWESIRLENWNFSYGSIDEKHTLKNINMEFKK